MASALRRPRSWGHVDPGTLHANVVASESATYRAVSAAGPSPELRVEVSDGAALAVSSTSGSGGLRVGVRASPASPGARVVLQLKLRERFGWWPVARARLDQPSLADPRVQTCTPYASVKASRA